MIQIKHSWWRGLLGWPYLVTHLDYMSYSDGQICHTENHLFEMEEGVWAVAWQIREPILNWLLETNIAWKAEQKGSQSGIWFRRKQDVILFKLTWS